MLPAKEPSVSSLQYGLFEAHSCGPYRFCVDARLHQPRRASERSGVKARTICCVSFGVTPYGNANASSTVYVRILGTKQTLVTTGHGTKTARKERRDRHRGQHQNLLDEGPLPVRISSDGACFHRIFRSAGSARAALHKGYSPRSATDSRKHGRRTDVQRGRNVSEKICGCVRRRGMGDLLVETSFTSGVGGTRQLRTAVQVVCAGRSRPGQPSKGLQQVTCLTFFKVHEAF